MNVDQILKRKWYFQGFNATPALVIGASISASLHMPKTLGYGYNAIVEFYEGDKCYFLYAWDDLHSILTELEKRVKEDPSYLSFLLKKDKEACDRSLEVYRSLKSLNELSMEELARTYSQVVDAYASVLSVSHIIEGFTLTTEDRIRKKVEELYNAEVFSVLTAPPSPSFLSTEQYDLLRIAKKVQKAGLQKVDDTISGEILADIQKHAQKYFWKRTGYSKATALQEKDFIDEINDLLKGDIDGKIQEYLEIRNNVQKKRQYLNDKELRELIEINDAIFQIHDHRKEVMTQSVYYVDFILAELSKRSSVDISLLRYMEKDEFLKVDALKEELKERQKKCIIITTENEREVFVGSIAQEYINQLNAQRKIESDRIIKGNGASAGRAQGPVKVCRGIAELSKVNTGDILVACMTQPEFVPAMKKAAAVVTDEGGLTCHAAIICRELKIPCVIGTKVATQVLKDGQKVNVDAKKGEVSVV